MNSRAAEFIQYLIPPNSAGPSLNTCHKLPLELVLVMAVLFISKRLSSLSTTIASEIGFVKLGQPVPESNLSSDENRGVPSITST